jgi:hypothetical protein
MKRRAVIALLIGSFFAWVGTAFAHERIEIGDYVFVLGWLEEPPLAGLKNAAYIEITLKSDGSPVTSAEGSLDARIEYGGRMRDLVLRPIQDTPGAYAGDFIPTRRGVYTLKLTGALGDQPIDISGEIEEVISAASMQFPEEQPSTDEVLQTIDEVRSEIGSARLFGIVGLALGATGVVLAGVVWGRKR